MEATSSGTSSMNESGSCQTVFLCHRQGHTQADGHKRSPCTRTCTFTEHPGCWPTCGRQPVFYGSLRRSVAQAALCRRSASSWPQLLPGKSSCLMGPGAPRRPGCLSTRPTCSGERETQKPAVTTGDGREIQKAQYKEEISTAGGQRHSYTQTNSRPGAHQYPPHPPTPVLM